MRKAGLSIAVFVFIALSFTTLAVMPGNVRATTLYVGGGGPGNYTTIQAAIDVASTGDTVYVFNGTYDERVVVDKILSLLGENKDGVTIDGGGTGDVITILSDWTNLSGFTIVNGGPDWFDAGIELHGVHGCRIFGNDIFSYSDRGVYLDSSEDNVIVNNTISSSTYDGIWIQNSPRSTIVGNNISNNRNGIHLIGSNGTTIADNDVFENHDGLVIGSDGIDITHNTVHSNVFYGIALMESERINIMANVVEDNTLGIHLSDSNNNNVFWNTIRDNEVAAVALTYSTNGSLVSNVMVGSGIVISGTELEEFDSHTINTANTVNGKPVYYWKNVAGGRVPDGAGQVILVNCTGVTVEDQYLYRASEGIMLGFSSGNRIVNNTAFSNHYGGIDLYYSHNNSIENNDIFLNTDRGMIVYWSDNNTIINNDVHSNLYLGIYVAVSAGNVIVNNTVIENGHGIYLSTVTDAVVRGNVVLSSTRNGIYLRIACHRNTVIGNLVSSSGQTGIYVWSSRSNLFTENVVSLSNDTGIYLRHTSTENSIYHNAFMYNTRQSYVEREPNQWDDGYPSGGNYWSDYLGLDQFSGPNQNQPGSDGIGDTPYLMDESGQDRYPLMSPAIEVPPQPPTQLNAILIGSAYEHVSLTWSLSRDDGGGLDSVAGYGVLRGSAYDPKGSGYVLRTTLPRDTSQFLDSLSGEGNPENYFYRVCAVDYDGNSACAEDQAGKFTRPLSPGPNLISIPLIQSNDNIETVLQTVEYDKAWYYDSSAEEWKWYMKHKGYRRGLWNMNHTTGIWVNVTNDCNLTSAGIVPAKTMIHLHSGWNLLGFPSFNALFSASDLKAEIGVTRVEGYDSTPPYHLRVLGDAEVLLAGYGYWVKVDIDVDWIVEVS